MFQHRMHTSALSSVSSSPKALARRVLVVDDHLDSARSLEMMFDALGFEAQCATDGIDALRKAASFRPHLVVLDISMPKLDGYDTCGVLRAQPWATDLRLIAITGWKSDELGEKSKAAGFDAYLLKPVDFDALKKIVEL